MGGGEKEKEEGWRWCGVAPTSERSKSKSIDEACKQSRKIACRATGDKELSKKPFMTTATTTTTTLPAIDALHTRPTFSLKLEQRNEKERITTTQRCQDGRLYIHPLLRISFYQIKYQTIFFWLNPQLILSQILLLPIRFLEFLECSSMQRFHLIWIHLTTFAG